MQTVAESARDTRSLLIETGARLLAEHGSDALTTRRLAREIGASTMAVYTHFGGMDDVRRAIRDAGYARLALVWGEVSRTRDPVADLTVSGASYVGFALANPNLYRAMFFEMPSDGTHVPPTDVAGTGVDFVRQCMNAGRFNQADPWSVMWQLWAATHGLAAGILAGMIPRAEIDERMRALGVTMYVGFGDDRPAAERSIARARRRTRRRIHVSAASRQRPR
jgi:AcrR family transcriptional regulator